jgi:hypothetical protein
MLFRGFLRGRTNSQLMSKALKRTNDLDKNDAYSCILQYMKFPESIALSGEHERILDRWILCNVMLKDRKLKEEDIVEKIQQKFEVSKYTARNDIGYTMALFVEARRFSKEYLLYNHIEDMGIMIEKWKLDKSLAPFVPKLLHEYTVAITKLPESINKQQRPKIINNFYVVNGQNVQAPMNYDEAVIEANKMIENDEKEGEKDYVDYEDVKKEEDDNDPAE